MGGELAKAPEFFLHCAAGGGGGWLGSWSWGTKAPPSCLRATEVGGVVQPSSPQSKRPFSSRQADWEPPALPMRGGLWAPLGLLCRGGSDSEGRGARCVQHCRSLLLLCRGLARGGEAGSPVLPLHWGKSAGGGHSAPPPDASPACLPVSSQASAAAPGQTDPLFPGPLSLALERLHGPPAGAQLCGSYRAGGHRPQGG